MREVGGSIPGCIIKQKTLKFEVLLLCLALNIKKLEADWPDGYKVQQDARKTLKMRNRLRLRSQSPAASVANTCPGNTLYGTTPSVIMDTFQADVLAPDGYPFP